MPARILLSVLLYSLLSPTASFAQSSECPESCIRFPYRGWEFCSSEPAAEQAVTFPQDCNGEFSGAYDIPEQWLHARSWGGFGECSPAVTVEDDFVVSGLPHGEPISFSARLDVVIDGGCILGPGEVSARVEHVGESSADRFWDMCTGGPTHHEGPVQLPITVQSGVPFRMKFELNALVGEAVADMLGSFGFENLPSNVVVTSCNGFVQGAVSTRAATMGRIKAFYR